ncbi:MarR family winged helix-turn-helix transcriptional regulator [Ideonella oryzae]|uniref:MarR family transcriptional regulator n=1 Tax=Ideonella oryzae TaxID=2937441 RepID=A0ABT1BKA5_9BURK|nr:MarR family transcriptional regulator [Ideonella oryzae]MCO5976638.1 MarR family transcriptional regulator [Ideonella oryzae]
MNSPPIPADFYQPAEFRPEISVGYMMRRVLASILADADQELAAWDMTHAQWMPLFKLYNCGQSTVAGLARDLQLDPGATTRLLDRLESKGLLRRERSTSDRRVVHVALTPEGQAIASQVPEVLCRVLNRHLSGFTHDEWMLLRGLLERILANGEALRLSQSSATAEGQGGAS